MKTLRIFIASSDELKSTRQSIVEHVAKKNRMIESGGVCIQVDIWEYMSSAIPPSGRAQDEYSKLLINDDIIAVLIKNKVGMYTREEFETALELREKNGKPEICIYALPPEKEEPSLGEFIKDLRPSGKYKLDYFPVKVNNDDELWNSISVELDKLIAECKPETQAQPQNNGSFTYIERQINTGGGDYTENNFK